MTRLDLEWSRLIATECLSIELVFDLFFCGSVE